MNSLMVILIIIIVFLSKVIGLSEECLNLNCPVCCTISLGKPSCTTDLLHCELEEEKNFNSFSNIIWILLGVFGGLPICLSVLEFFSQSRFLIIFEWVYSVFLKIKKTFKNIKIFRERSQVSHQSIETNDDLDLESVSLEYRKNA